MTVYVIVSSITIFTAHRCPNLSFGVTQYKGGANRGTQRAKTASVGAGERQKVLEVSLIQGSILNIFEI